MEHHTSLGIVVALVEATAKHTMLGEQPITDIITQDGQHRLPLLHIRHILQENRSAHLVRLQAHLPQLLFMDSLKKLLLMPALHRHRILMQKIIPLHVPTIQGRLLSLPKVMQKMISKPLRLQIPVMAHFQWNLGLWLQTVQ